MFSIELVNEVHALQNHAINANKQSNGIVSFVKSPIHDDDEEYKDHVVAFFNFNWAISLNDAWNLTERLQSTFGINLNGEQKIASIFHMENNTTVFVCV